MCSSVHTYCAPCTDLYCTGDVLPVSRTEKGSLALNFRLDLHPNSPILEIGCLSLVQGKALSLSPVQINFRPALHLYKETLILKTSCLFPVLSRSHLSVEEQ